MCFPPEIKRAPFVSAPLPSNPQSNGLHRRPHVSEEFDKAVSQFMASFQSQQSAKPQLMSQQGFQLQHPIKPQATPQQSPAIQRQIVTQQSPAIQRQAFKQQQLMTQLQIRVNSTIGLQQATSAVRLPATDIYGASLPFSNSVAGAALPPSAAPSLLGSVSRPDALLSAHPAHAYSAARGFPLSAVSTTLGIPAQTAYNELMSSGLGVCLPSVSGGLSPLASNVTSSANLDYEEDDGKKVRRIMSNRQSAKRSRQRKRERLDELEEEVAALAQQREEANRKLSEAEKGMERLRATNQRMKEEIERLRGEVTNASAKQSQHPSPVFSATESVEAARIRYELGPAQKKLRSAEVTTGDLADLKASVAQGDALNGPSSPCSGVSQAGYTYADGMSNACVKQEAAPGEAGDGLGFFECGLTVMEGGMGSLLGEAPQGLELLDNALVRAMLDCMSESVLI